MKITKDVTVTVQIDGDKCSLDCNHFFQKYCGLYGKKLKIEIIYNRDEKHLLKRCKKCVEDFGFDNKPLN